MPFDRSRFHAAELARRVRDDIPVTRYNGFHLEIAALIVLIKRPAVAPNSEMSDTKDFRNWAFSSCQCRSMGLTGEGWVVGGTRVYAHCVVKL
jgi:hypothetical protein